MRVRSTALPLESVAKIADVRDAGLRSLEIYRKAGVKMGYGSDLLGPSQRLQSDEFRIRAEIQGAREVIASATLIGAEVLGMEGKLGRIVPDSHSRICWWSMATRCATSIVPARSGRAHSAGDEGGQGPVRQAGRIAVNVDDLAEDTA